MVICELDAFALCLESRIQDCLHQDTSVFQLFFLVRRACLEDYGMPRKRFDLLWFPAH